MVKYLMLLATDISSGNLPKTKADTGTVQDVMVIIFGVIGALAFLMVVISGFRFIISAGEPDKAAQARSGLIYSLIGLLIALSAEAIVVFAINRI